MNLKLGKLPVKFDERTLRLENFLDVPKLPPLTETTDWFAMTSSFNMGGNDKVGNCVRVGAAHMKQTWTANAGREIITPDKQLVDEYFMLTGNEDSGLVMLDFLKYWRKTGFSNGEDKIGAFAAIDPRNLTSWRYGNFLFGGIFGGFELPQSAMDQFDRGETFEVVQGSDIVGGHCMNGGIATPRLISLGTWAQKHWATLQWIGQYCSEAYVIISLDWFDKDHQAPSGFNWPELKKFLAAVTK